MLYCSYICWDCGHKGEERRPTTDRDNIKMCSACGKLSLRRGSRNCWDPIARISPVFRSSYIRVGRRRFAGVIENCYFEGVRIAVTLQGGHVYATNLIAINTQTMLALSRGATVDAVNIIHHIGSSKSTSRRPERRRKRRSSRAMSSQG
jgi:hypothetical protein